MTTRSAEPGDIARVDYDGGSAHLLYLGHHSAYGDAIRVANVAILPASPKELDAVLASGFTVFYPFALAVRKGLIHIVSRTASDVAVPTIMRRAGAISKEGKTLTWIIVEDGKTRVVQRLSPDELKLPLGSIWNHEFLCTRLREKWHPGEPR